MGNNEAAVTTPSEEGVIKAPLEEGVTTTLPEKGAITALSEEGVTTAPPEEDVTTTPPEEEVTTTPPEEGVTTVPPEEGVITALPEEREITAPHEEGATTTSPKEEGVTTTLTEEGAITAPPEKGVTTFLPEEGVTTNSPKEEGVTTTLPEERAITTSSKEDAPNTSLATAMDNNVEDASAHIPRLPEVKKQTKQAKQAQKRVFSAPCGNSEMMAQDFLDFGFDKKEVKEMMHRRAHSVDSVQPHARSVDLRVNQSPVQNRQQARRQAANSKRHVRSGVRDLVLTNDPSWVLFDCNKGFPTFDPTQQVPRIFQKYARYEPGSTRIVEYNVNTRSLRLKCTPEVLRTRSIHYSKDGPKLVDLVDIEPMQRYVPPNRRGNARGRGRGINKRQRASLNDVEIPQTSVETSSHADASKLSPSEEKSVIKHNQHVSINDSTEAERVD